MQQLEESIGRYLADLDRADRDPTEVAEARAEHLTQGRDSQSADAAAEANRRAHNTVRRWTSYH